MADAAGLAGLILAGNTPTPPNTKLARLARATESRVPWRAVPDAASFLGEQATAGASVLALEITDRSRSLLDYIPPPPRPIYLVAGNEAHGVAQPILDVCHAAIHLPMYGHNSSMNVAVALGAAVYSLLPRL